MTIEHHTLSNGINVLIQPYPEARKTSLRHYYRVGSRQEQEREHGLAHFLEHMFFKTEAYKNAVRRGWKTGVANASTNIDQTTYMLDGFSCNRASVRKYNELLTDMVAFPSFSEKDVVLERGAVLREIAMRNDILPQVADENAYCAAFSDGALGRVIIGTPESVNNYSAEMCLDFAQRHYHTGNLIISVSGRVDPDTILEDLEQASSRIPDGELRSLNAVPYKGGALHMPRNESGQLNLSLAFEAVAGADKLAYAIDLMTDVLGGYDVLSPRLYTEIREKRGLAYGVNASFGTSIDYGLVYISAGVGIDQGDEVLAIIGKEIHKLQNKPVTKKELNNVKSNYKDYHLDVDEALRLYDAFGRVVQQEELIEGYNAVTAEDIMKAAQLVFSSLPSLSTVGPEGSQPDYDKLVKALEM
jgi:predicted Zn-dependent peptidase